MHWCCDIFNKQLALNQKISIFGGYFRLISNACRVQEDFDNLSCFSNVQQEHFPFISRHSLSLFPSRYVCNNNNIMSLHYEEETNSLENAIEILNNTQKTIYD